VTHAKVQHYVPQVMLREFASPSDGQVCVYDKQTDAMFRAYPRRIAAVSAFYDLKVPNGILTLEPALADLEAKAAEIIGRIRAAESLAGVMEEDRHILAVFIAAQHVRTEHFRRSIQNVDSQLADVLKTRGIDPEKVENYRPFHGEDDVKEFALRVLPDLTIELAPHVVAKDWILVRSPNDQPLLLGDNPVALHNERTFGFYGNIGFAVPGIEMYLPISRRLSLYLTCLTNGDKFRDSWNRLQEIRAAGVADEATDALERKLEPMYRAITNGAPLDMRPENVLHHNALQIRYAGRWVFSSDEDFSLVRQMIADDPKYRQGPFGTVN
jgi:hypothetical protein